MPFTRRYSLRKRTVRRARRPMRRSFKRPLRTRRYRPKVMHRRRRVNVGDYYKRVFRRDGPTIQLDGTPVLYDLNYTIAAQNPLNALKAFFGETEGTLLFGLFNSFSHYRLKRMTAKVIPQQMPINWLGQQGTNGEPLKVLSYPFHLAGTTQALSLFGTGVNVYNDWVPVTQPLTSLQPKSYQDTVNTTGCKTHPVGRPFKRSFRPKFFVPTAQPFCQGLRNTSVDARVPMINHSYTTKAGWLPTASSSGTEYRSEGGSYSAGENAGPTIDSTYWSGGSLRFPGVTSQGFQVPAYEVMEFYTFEFKGRRALGTSLRQLYGADVVDTPAPPPTLPAGEAGENKLSEMMANMII